MPHNLMSAYLEARRDTVLDSLKLILPDNFVTLQQFSGT